MERGKQLPSVAVGAMGFHSRMGGTLHRKAQDQLATALATYQIHWDNYKRKTK